MAEHAQFRLFDPHAGREAACTFSDGGVGLARAVDPRRTRKALKRVQALAEAGAPLSEWERAFLEEVSARLEKFGSAFADYAKGAPDEALSRLQDGKLREIRAKARAETRVKAEPPEEVKPRKPSAWARRTPLRSRPPPREE